MAPGAVHTVHTVHAIWDATSTSFFMTFMKQRQQLNEELVKDGIESPEPPVPDDTPSEGTEDLWDKLAGTEGLRGRTENEEACLCMPGTLHAPDSQQALSKEAEEAEQGLFTFLGSKFHRENAKVNQHMDPAFSKFEKEKIKWDKVVDKLHQKAAVAEEKATQLKEAFHKVQVAHEEGNCQRATAAAEANFQELPLCKQDLDQAAEDMTTQFHLAQPSCKRGAVMLQALREMSMPWPLLAARISELQHQRRADFL